MNNSSYMMKKVVLSLFFAVAVTALAGSAVAQETNKNVLFVGNSYTDVNNLPSLVQQVSRSAGRSISCSSNTPGGCTFQQHCSNQSMTLIRQGGWDAVVLQEQSQFPSFPQNQVESDVFPYAARLVDSVYAHNPCADPMFYMTWGRKNGDAANAASFPVLGTYEGMDSMLYERYMYMKNSNDASVSPVGRVWHYLRTNSSDIELYMADGSHPSLAGSYAAACTFYVMLFEDTPLNITDDASLDAATAQTIRQAVEQVVYDTLSFWQRPQPVAAFSYGADEGTVTFQNASQQAEDYLWGFGDSASSAELAPTHIYSDTGTYTVVLVASRHCMSDTTLQEIHIASVAADSTGDTTVSLVPLTNGALRLYPNPASHHLVLESPSAGTAVLCDMQGRRSKRYVVAAGSNALDVSNLAPGVYVLRMGTAALRVVLR